MVLPGPVPSRPSGGCSENRLDKLYCAADKYLHYRAISLLCWSALWSWMNTTESHSITPLFTAPLSKHKRAFEKLGCHWKPALCQEHFVHERNKSVSFENDLHPPHLEGNVLVLQRPHTNINIPIWSHEKEELHAVCTHTPSVQRYKTCWDIKWSISIIRPVAKRNKSINCTIKKKWAQ